MNSKIYTHYKRELNEKPSFLVGQKAFIVNNVGRVLILKRHERSTQGEMWDFPGGRVGFEESLRTGLTREVKEEVKLTLTKVSLPLSITTFIRDIDRNTQIVRIIYLCKVGGKTKLSKEHCEYLWIDPKDHKQYTFISEDYHQAFENFLKFKPKTKEFLNKGMLNESLEYLRAHK